MSNGCGAVYVGQTGSGKTHTMEGPISDRGLTFRALEELLVRRASRLASGTTTISLCLSMLEVYNRGSQCWALLIFHNILVAGG